MTENPAPNPSPEKVLAAAERVPRSWLETPSYEFDWRWRQVEIYLEALREAGVDHYVPLPASEKDFFLRKLYDVRAGGLPPDCSDARIVRWVIDCQENTRLGAMIRAMTIAGRDDAEIAATLSVGLGYIRNFLALFFDVRKHMENRHYVANIVFPFGGCPEPMDDEQRRERVMLAVAYNGSRELLDAVMREDVCLTPELTAEYYMLFKATLGMSAFGATIIERATRAPVPSDVERAIALKGISRPDDGGEGQSPLDPANWLNCALTAFDRGIERREGG